MIAILLGGCSMHSSGKEKTIAESTHWVTTWSQAFKGTGLFPINDNQHDENL
jgi:hypothetical protein